MHPFPKQPHLAESLHFGGVGVADELETERTPCHGAARMTPLQGSFSLVCTAFPRAPLWAMLFRPVGACQFLHAPALGNAQGPPVQSNDPSSEGAQ